MEAVATYPANARSTVQRLKKRGEWMSLGVLLSLLSLLTVMGKLSCLRIFHHPCHCQHCIHPPCVLHAILGRPFPTTLPMIGHMGSFSHHADPATEPLDLYLHGYISSRLMRLPESTPSASQDDSSNTGLPVCVSATHLDGIVLAYTPFHHSMNYRSAVLHGFADPVTDAEEKLWAMQLITDGVVSGRWENSRVPPMKVELQSTQILKVRVVSASAKIRTGGPSEDRKDLKDEDMRKRVWTGVVPVWETWGSPVPAKDNMVESVPEHLLRATDTANEAHEQYARKVVSGDE